MLRIALDESCLRVEPGDKIVGSVSAEPVYDIDCRLSVACEWCTRGEGNLRTGRAMPVDLHSGSLQGGESHTFSFELTAPSSPFSYEGEYLSIDWCVRVVADPLRTFDHEVRADFELVPGAHNPEPQALVAHRDQFKKNDAALTGCLAFFGIVLVLGGIFNPPVGWFFAAIGAVMAFFGFRNRLAQSKLGQIHAVLDSETIHPGTILPVELSMTPHSRAHIRSIKATLSGKEETIAGTGKTKRTKNHILWKETTQLDTPGVLSPGRPTSFNLEVPVPDIRAYSFSAPSNKIEWLLVVQVDVAGWPDWVQNYFLLMWPPGGGANRALEAPHPKLIEGPQRTVAPAVEQPAEWQPQPQTSVAPTLDELAFPDSESLAVGDPATVAEREPVTVRGPVFGLIDELLALPSYSSKHWEVIAKHKDDELELGITVDRAEHTFAFDVPDVFEGGRTVHGTLVGSEQAVSVALQKDRNAEADGWKSGDVIALTARPVKWNTLFNRLELHE